MAASRSRTARRPSFGDDPALEPAPPATRPEVVPDGPEGAGSAAGATAPAEQVSTTDGSEAGRTLATVTPQQPTTATTSAHHGPGGTAGPAPGALFRVAHQALPRRAIARMFEADLSAPVVAAGIRTQNPRELSERVAMGRALWRELVIGFASQLGSLRLGFTQLAALYVLADGGTTTVADLADTLGRSPSATSRLVDGLVRRRLVERRPETDDRRQKSLWLTQRGKALLRLVDRSRADQFLTAVRPMQPAERSLIAMGVAALATRAISRRGRLIKQPRD